MSNNLSLNYWGIRGLGQVPRLLLEYTGAQWDDVIYESRDKWFQKDKHELGIPLANLPFLVDGDYKLT